jgi:hypothetical protein
VNDESEEEILDYQRAPQREYGMAFEDDSVARDFAPEVATALR